MRTRPVVLQTVLLVLAAIMLLPGLLQAQNSSPTGTPNPCEFPKDAATAGLTQLAHDEYKSLFKATPELQCARDGIIATGLALTPTPQPTATPTPLPIDVIKTLNSNGRTDEANALLTEEIKRDPGVDIPKTLSNLVGNPWNDWRDASVSFGTWIQALINHAGKLATSMVTSIVPIIAAYIILKRLLQRQFRPMDEPAHVDIALFNAEQDDLKIGHQLTEAIQVAYQNTQNAKLGINAKLIDQVPAATETNAQVEILKVSSSPFLAIFEYLAVKPKEAYVLSGRTVAGCRNHPHTQTKQRHRENNHNPRGYISCEQLQWR